MAASNIFRKLTEYRSALDQGRDQLDAIRDQIRERRTELEQIEFHHLDTEAATARIRKAIAYSRSQGVSTGWQDSKAGIALLIQQFNTTLGSKPFDMLAVLAPDLLEAGLVAELSPGGMSAEAKATRTESLLTEISGLERDEEKLARELEAAGATVPRRADAPPEILLASDADLGG